MHLVCSHCGEGYLLASGASGCPRCERLPADHLPVRAAADSHRGKEPLNVGSFILKLLLVAIAGAVLLFVVGFFIVLSAIPWAK